MTTNISPVGIQFTETMRGYFSSKVKDDYESAARQGKEDSSKFEFTLTVTADDLDNFLNQENHQAQLVGSVTAPAISSQPLKVNEGEFNLFVVDSTRVETRQMRYRMQMVAEDGKVYYLDGFKLIHNDPGFDLWSDTTTLYIDVYDGESDSSPLLGKGILQILPEDFMRQMTTIKATNAETTEQNLKAIALFGYFFGGVL
ncbi:MAG: hypothetical protein F6K10_40535 [Moorea sp. SIO2B7]|nr:hypothetical protein [Moorena sp. SIO2B7]